MDEFCPILTVKKIGNQLNNQKLAISPQNWPIPSNRMSKKLETGNGFPKMQMKEEEEGVEGAEEVVHSYRVSLVVVNLIIQFVISSNRLAISIGKSSINSSN